MKNEKLLLTGAGFNSRPIGLFLTLFLSLLLAVEVFTFYKVVFQPGESLDFGGLTFNSRTVECSGMRDALYDVKMNRYRATHQVSDLPSNCSATEEKTVSPWLLGVFIIITALFLSGSAPYKNITLGVDTLLIHKGNVFFAGRKKFLLSQLKQITFHRQKKKLLFLLPYDVLALLIEGEENVDFSTKISLSKSDMKVVESAIRQFKRAFESHPQVQILSEIS